MQEVLIDRKCAAPRFVIKPQSTFTMEGQSARFTCRIISLTNCSVSWYHNNVELRQSVKYMKRYIGDDYTFIINRCKVEDRGEFIIHAENHYGVTEEPVFLNVQPVPKDLPRYEPEPLPVRKRELNTYNDGVITIEIINCQPSDSGKYKCTASNSLGSDSTDCVVIVEGNNMSEEQKQMSDSILYSDHRYLSRVVSNGPPL